MKTFEAAVAILSWIILAVVLYALSPLLIKLIKTANSLHHLFGR